MYFAEGVILSVGILCSGAVNRFYNNTNVLCVVDFINEINLDNL